MKTRLCALILCSIVTAHQLISQPLFSFFHEKVLSYEAWFEALGPLVEGSPAEKAAHAFIAAQAEGAELTVLDFSGFEGAHSFSRITAVRVPGEREDTLLVVVPLDGAYAPALALALIDHFRSDKPPMSLDILFSAAEKGPQPDYPLGSRLYLREVAPAAPLVVYYLELPERPYGLEIETGAADHVAPAWLVRLTADTLQASAIPFRVFGSRNKVFRLGRPDRFYPTAAFLEAGHPALLIGSGPPDSAVVRDDRRLLEFFEGLLAEMARGIPTEGDSHYLFLDLRRSFILVEEADYLMILIGLFVLSFAYAVNVPALLRRYFRTFLKNIWNIPVLYALCLAVLTAATAATRAVLSLRSMPDLWQLYPGLFFALKLSLAVFFLALAFRTLRRLPFSRNGSFYSAASIFMLFLDVLIFSAIDLAFGFYFLWAYVFAFAFSLLKNRIAKFMTLFLSPLLLLGAAVDVLSLPELRVTRMLLLSPLLGNVFLAFMILPFFLLFVRMDLIIRHPGGGRAGFGMKLFTGSLGILSFILSTISLSVDPYHSSPQPLRVIETHDRLNNAHALVLESPAPLGTFELDFGDRSIHVDTRSRRLVVPLEEIPDPLRLDKDISELLDRTFFDLSLDSSLPLRSIELSVASDSPLIVYDSNFPYSLSLDQTGARIHTGRHPPRPLNYELTFPRYGDLRFRIEADFGTLSQPIAVRGADFLIESRMKYVAAFELRAGP